MKLLFRESGKEEGRVVSFLDEGTLFVTEEINSEIAFGESTRYSIELLSEERELDDIVSIRVYLNDDYEIARWIKGVEERLFFSEKCYFIGQIDLLQFSINIVYADGSSARKISEYYMCTFKHDEDFKNLENIITDILEFEDEHIVAHMFALTSNQTSSNAALIRASLLPKSFKTLKTIIEFIKDICTCYRVHLPFFQRKAHHRVVTARSVVPIEAVRTVSESSVLWLAQTPEAISKNPRRDGCLSSLPNGYIPTSLESQLEKRSFDVYENRICCAFIAKILSFIQQLDFTLSKSRKRAEDFLRKYTKIEKAKAPVLILKHQLLKIQIPLCDQVQYLRNELFGLKKQYDKILKCKYSELSSLPKATKVFLNNPVYHSFFKLILAWYKDGDFEQAGDDRIFKARTATELYEIYCLQQLLNKFKQSGFNIERVENPLFQYPVVPLRQFSKKSHIVANTYSFSKDDVQITLYYEPRIYSFLPEGDYGSTMPNGLELYRVDTVNKKNYWEPDFVLRIQDEKETSYVILDAKYAFSSRISPSFSHESKHFEGHLASIIEKYYTYTHTFNRASIRMVWTLQGRIDPDCQFKKFGAANAISPNFVPSVSFGNCPINTDNNKNSMRKLWNEICSLIPCMRPFAEEEDEDYAEHNKKEIVVDETTASVPPSDKVLSIPTEDIANMTTTELDSSLPKTGRVVISQEDKRDFCKQLWLNCIQSIMGAERIKSRFRALPPATYGHSYTLFNYKKLGAKVSLFADFDSFCVAINFTLPNIHKGEQSDLYRKITNDKSLIMEELKSLKHKNHQLRFEWGKENNCFTLSVLVDFDYTKPTEIDCIVESAYVLKGCIDRYR